MPKTTVLDTNAIIRFLINDIPSQANQVEQIILSSPKNSLEIPTLIISETIYVLLSFYKKDKVQIVQSLNDFLSLKQTKTSLLTHLSLQIYSQNNISFEDAYLIATTKQSPQKTIFSFDQQLNRLLKKSKS